MGGLVSASRRRALRSTAAACGVALSIAACGGTTTTSGTHGAPIHSVVDAAFAQRATVACQQANQLNLNAPSSPPPYPRFNPQRPTASEMPAMGRWIQNGIPLERQALNLAEKLGQPSSGAASWNRFLTAADQWVKELQTQATAAERAQVEPFVTSTRVLQSDLNAYRSAAVKAGVPACGGIFGPQGPAPEPFPASVP